MKLTITLSDGRTAQAERGTWSSTDPGLATYCTISTAKEAAANHLSLAFLESAKRLATKLGGTLEVEGAIVNFKRDAVHSA